MANQFITIPVPAGNGIGASVNVSNTKALKSVLVGSIQSATVTIEVSQNGSDFAPVLRFDQPGNVDTLQLIAFSIRTRVENFVPGVSVSPTVSLGAEV